MDQILLHYREVNHRRRLERADRIEDLALALRPNVLDVIKQMRHPDGGP